MQYVQEIHQNKTIFLGYTFSFELYRLSKTKKRVYREKLLIYSLNDNRISRLNYFGFHPLYPQIAIHFLKYYNVLYWTTQSPLQGQGPQERHHL